MNHKKPFLLPLFALLALLAALTWLGLQPALAVNNQQPTKNTQKLTINHLPLTIHNSLPAWHTTIVDLDDVDGHAVDVVLDAQGYPHVSSVTFVNPGGITYTYWDGVRWWAETVDQGFRPGRDTAVQLDAQNQPAVAYINQDEHQIWLARRAPTGAWQTELVEDSTAGFASDVTLAFDSQDRPFLAYFVENTLLHVASRTPAGAWTIEELTAEAGGSTGLSNLVIDQFDRRHLAYSNSPGQFQPWELVYTRYDGAAWQPQIVLTDTFRFDTIALALNSDTQPRLAYSYTDTVEYAAWNGVNWSIETLGNTGDPTDLDLLLDSSSNAHVFVSTFPSRSITHYRRQAGLWITSTLTPVDAVYDIAAAADAQDNLHLFAKDDDNSDLVAMFYGPAWDVVPVDPSPNVASPVLDLAANLPLPSYHAAYSGELRLMERTPGQWQPRPFATAIFPGASSSIHYVPAGVNAPEQYTASYYDSDNEQLVYARIRANGVFSDVVDQGTDVGQYNVLQPHPTYPSIAYWNGSSYRLSLAVNLINTWRVYTNTLSPALYVDALDAARTGANSPVEVWVSYHDGSSDSLRLAAWTLASGAWITDTRVGPGGFLHSLELDTSTGAPVIAYHDPISQSIQLATYQNGAWAVETAVPNVPTISSLHLELGLGQSARPRIAYTRFSPAALYFAYKTDGVWLVETVDTPPGAFFLTSARLALGERPYVLFADFTFGLQLAVRRAPVDLPEAAPYVPTSPGTDVDDDDADDTSWCEPGLLRAGGASATGIAALAGASADDFLVFDRLTDLFYPSAGGQRYVDLYVTHAAEMGQIALHDPALLWDAYRTLRGFMPGLDALTAGQGSQVVVTQEMADNALDVWTRMAAVASPALTQVINQELAASNNLQDFVGLTFDEWAQAIGVTPGADYALYLPIIP